MRRRLLPGIGGYQIEKKSGGSSASDYIYVVGTDSGLVKIGTTNNWFFRINTIRSMSPVKIELLMFWACKSGKSVEAALHAMFRDFREHGEWFRFGVWSTQ